MARDTGWTFREIEKLTLFELYDLFASWKRCPPLHTLVAMYLGAFKPETEAPTRIVSVEQLKALANMQGREVVRLSE